DLFFLHSNIVPDESFVARAGPDAAQRMTPYATFVDRVRPLFERFVAEGLIGAWGLTGIGHPDTIIKVLGERPAPAAVQCIANLLDSPGGLKFFDGPAKPRAVMAAARGDGGGGTGGPAGEGAGAGERRRRHGDPRGAGRGADSRHRPRLAGGSPRTARLRARLRFPP